ncbi:MAG: TVP38/TMEM64 family protein [Pseudomonadota bacterium]
MRLKRRHKRLLIAVSLTLLFALFLTVVLLSVTPALGDWCQWCSQISVDSIVQFVHSTGPWGVGVAIGLMIIHSFVPFPAELVAIANGMIYGPVWGMVITWIGAMIGAYLAFGLARLLGRPFVERLLTQNNRQMMDKWISKHGGRTLLFSRFLPVIAFNLINYAAGLTKISGWTFTWATGMGILPVTFLMVIMGDQIESLPWQVWLALLVVGLLLWVLTHYAIKRWKDTAS